MKTLLYEYEAYLEQTGTSAPVEKLLVPSANPLPFSPTWSRFAEGNFCITCPGAFFVDNTIISFVTAYQSEGENAGIVRANPFIDQMPDKVYFLFADNNNILKDNHRFWVRIRVFG